MPQPKRFGLTAEPAEAAEEDETFAVDPGTTEDLQGRHAFSGLPEGRTHRVWLCDLGDLCGEKSGMGAA